MSFELRSYEFTGESEGPHLLITGGVHGDEYEPIAALRELVKMFLNGEHRVANLTGRVTIIPCVNEEAFRLGERCGADGLDLARICPGRADGSTTERTAYALSEFVRSADYYIDLHTGGTLFSIYPLAGYMLHPNPEVLAQQRVMAKAFGLNVVWGTSADLEGRSLSVARDANVPAIYCEYLGAATYPSEGAAAYVDGCLRVMVEIGLLQKNQNVSDHVPEFIVEDERPASGHLQVCQPSPVDGDFSPLVKLGERVQAGDVFGFVCAPNEFLPTTIYAEETGIVLMVRTFPKVCAGESVGVVLPVD